jgi:hypothetical protein
MELGLLNVVVLVLSALMVLCGFYALLMQKTYLNAGDGKETTIALACAFGPVRSERGYADLPVACRPSLPNSGKRLCASAGGRNRQRSFGRVFGLGGGLLGQAVEWSHLTPMPTPNERSSGRRCHRSSTLASRNEALDHWKEWPPRFRSVGNITQPHSTPFIQWSMFGTSSNLLPGSSARVDSSSFTIPSTLSAQSSWPLDALRPPATMSRVSGAAESEIAEDDHLGLALIVNSRRSDRDAQT